MKAIKYTDFDDFRENGKAGAFMVMECDGEIHGIANKCPGCGYESFLPVGEGPIPRWQYDGNGDAPTLTPSVHHNETKGGCGWHGYLTNGEWRL